MPDSNLTKTPLPDPGAPHFLVFVPGFLGSTLRSKTTKKTVWIDFTSIPLNPLEWGHWLDGLMTAMNYPNDDLEPVGIVDDIVFVPPWAKQEQYSRLLRSLEGMGFRADPTKHTEDQLDVYTFPYDWRQDNRISGRQLAAAVDKWSAFHPGAQVWMLAHSNGGVVARWYIEKEGGRDKVSRLYLLASPWDGSVKAAHVLQTGFETFFRQRFNLFDFNIANRTRDVLRTFPAIYQLIPHQDPFLRGPDNEPVDPFNGAAWLDNDAQRALLADAVKFNQELGPQLSVDTTCYYGLSQPTSTYGIVQPAAQGRWGAVEWHDTTAGDGTLAQRSAMNSNARVNIPFVAGHGDIYVNPAFVEVFKAQLVTVPGIVERAMLTVGQHTILFEPSRDLYAPGDSIALWCTITDDKTNKPVPGATISVQLKWRAPLPGSGRVTPPTKLPSARLWETEKTPGRYEGKLKAPATEGYYTLSASVAQSGQPAVYLEELIAIEAA